MIKEGKRQILRQVLSEVMPHLTVEVGTQRHNNSEDGQSTELLSRHSPEFLSIDKDEQAVANARQVTSRGQMVLGDGEAILKTLNRPIDLLYLDGSDNPEENLAQFLAAPLSEKSVVVIDDCMCYKGREYGKGDAIIHAKPLAWDLELTDFIGRYRMAILRRKV